VCWRVLLVRSQHGFYRASVLRRSVVHVERLTRDDKLPLLRSSRNFQKQSYVSSVRTHDSLSMLSAEPLVQLDSGLQASSAAKSSQPEWFRPPSLPFLFLFRPSPLLLPSSLLNACSLPRTAFFSTTTLPSRLGSQFGHNFRRSEGTRKRTNKQACERAKLAALQLG